MLYIPTMNQDYPAKYESRLTLHDGRAVLIRPIAQTDEYLLVDLLNKLSAEALYLRFLRPVSALPEALLYQLTHINYESNFALAAVFEEDGKESIIAVARYGFDPREKVTDFAIVVRDDWQHHGLGKFLITKIFAIGREHGITRCESIINSTNTVMKQLLRKLGLTVKYSYKNGATLVEILL